MACWPGVCRCRRPRRAVEWLMLRPAKTNTFNVVSQNHQFSKRCIVHFHCSHMFIKVSSFSLCPHRSPPPLQALALGACPPGSRAAGLRMTILLCWAGSGDSYLSSISNGEVVSSIIVNSGGRRPFVWGFHDSIYKSVAFHIGIIGKHSRTKQSNSCRQFTIRPNHLIRLYNTSVHIHQLLETPTKYGLGSISCLG